MNTLIVPEVFQTSLCISSKNKTGTIYAAPAKALNFSKGLSKCYFA
jgi:hypothetical protein